LGMSAFTRRIIAPRRARCDIRTSGRRKSGSTGANGNNISGRAPGEVSPKSDN
jgi:hypothetical protein